MLPNVFSYLDAGSGSMILQMIVGGTAAAAVSVRLFWGRIKSFLRFGRQDVPDEGAAEPDR
jgi:hypothetical protein